MKKYIYIIGVIILFTSCKIGKEYTRMELDMPENYPEYLGDTTCLADMKWWDVYADTNLRKLINSTLKNNKDMNIAVAKVKEMAAKKQIDFANYFPQINGSVYAQNEGLNYGGNDYGNDFDTEFIYAVSWGSVYQLDFNTQEWIPVGFG